MDSVNEVGSAEAVVFFDGVCNFCNGTVNFVIDRNHKGSLKFASLQSNYASEVLGTHNVDTSQLQSIIVLEGDRVFQKSRAALRIASKMDGLWPLLNFFLIIPPFIRDLVYDFIAKNRYKWFGQLDACRIPSPDMKERFLD